MDEGALDFPAWVEPGLAARLELKDRWREFRQTKPIPHRWRPRAAASLESPLWDDLLTKLDPAWTGSPIEFRHPYLDERVLRFFLRLPAMPWCREKLILRQAMSGLLPEAILDRKKTPQSGEPEYEAAKGGLYPSWSRNQELKRFVDFSRLPARVEDGPARFWLDQRAHALGLWLKNLKTTVHPASIPIGREERSEQEGNRSARGADSEALQQARVDAPRKRRRHNRNGGAQRRKGRGDHPRNAKDKGLAP